VQAYLTTAGPDRHLQRLPRNAVVFAQGDLSRTVCFVITGRLMLSVSAPSGREVVIAVAGPGDFVGEGCLAGAEARTATATTLEPVTVAHLDKHGLAELLRTEPALARHFVQALLARSMVLEAQLAAQMLTGSEERLVHLLLLLASPEDQHGVATLPRVSQEVLARMVGTTRSRVNVLLQRLHAYGVRPARTGLRLEPRRLKSWRPHSAAVR
jgi:CRP-like cAMP-binding protein